MLILKVMSRSVYLSKGVVALAFSIYIKMSGSESQGQEEVTCVHVIRHRKNALYIRDPY